MIIHHLRFKAVDLPAKGFESSSKAKLIRPIE